MRRLINWLVVLVERHPSLQGILGLLGAIVFLILIALFVNFLSTPVEIIFEQDAPNFPCSLGGCD